MRKLAWAALPFAAAVFLAEYLLPVKGLPYLAAALFLLSPAALFCRGGARKRLLFCLLAAAVGFGCCWLHDMFRLAPCQALLGQDVSVRARVADYPVRGEGYSRVDVVLMTEGLPPVEAALYRYDEPLPELRPGDLIETEIRVTRQLDSFTARNTLLRGYIRGELTVSGRWRFAALCFPQTVCKALKDACDRVFPERAAALMKAMMTGDTADLRADQESYAAMRSCGVTHIVAVSGMHMVFVVSFVQLLLGRGRRGALLCLPLMLLFVLMTGASPSVIRAAILVGLALIAPLFGRESDGVTSLSAALALLLLANPSAARSLSLQLSFAAAAGLMLLLPPLERALRKRLKLRNRLLRLLADCLLCTVGASVFTVPLAALYFGTVPLLSALANLLTLPLLELVFLAGYAVSALGLLLPGVAAVLAYLPAGALAYCRLVYRLLARLPFGSLYTSNPFSVVWLALVYALFLYFLVRKKGEPFRPILPLSLSVCSLCLLLLGTGIFGTRGSAVTVLDVGQGACTVLQSGGAVVVVDCGGMGESENAGDTAANYLLGHGQRDVDLLVLTHLHSDHANGVSELIYRMPVRRVALTAPTDDGAGELEAIQAAAEARGTELIYLDETCGMRVGDIELGLYLSQGGQDENENGLAVRGELGGCTALLTGDLGEEGELALLTCGAAEDVEILVAGHHGSKYSSSALFLNAARPEWSVVSVGYNSYGHPTEEALERLETYSENVRRTDLDGNVTIRMD